MFGHREVAALHHALHKAALVAALYLLLQSVQIRSGITKPRAQRDKLIRVGRGAQQNYFEFCLCHISSVRAIARVISSSSRWVWLVT